MVSAGGEAPTEFTYGTVTGIDGNQINLTEYDYEKDEDVAASYFVNDKTEYKGVNGLQDIVVGDVIDVIYSEIDGKRLSAHISIEKPDTDLEMDESDSENLQIEEEIPNPESTVK